MSQVAAAQLIYTRVEAEYSPRGRAGYQTVYSSPSLSAAEAELIERRVQRFRPAHPADARLQYFQLAGGKAVLSRSVVIRSDPAITDRLARAGVFLAHCLVLSPGEFERAGCNPFALFEAFAFLDDPALLARDYLRAGWVEEPARVDAGEVSFTTTWPEPEAFKLVVAGLRAAEDLRTGRGLALLGSADAIAATVRTLFARLPPSRRAACSFDTWAEGCADEAGVFWAVGAARLEADSLRTPVDVAARRAPAPGPRRWSWRR